MPYINHPLPVWRLITKRGPFQPWPPPLCAPGEQRSVKHLGPSIPLQGGSATTIACLECLKTWTVLAGPEGVPADWKQVRCERCDGAKGRLRCQKTP